MLRCVKEVQEKLAAIDLFKGKNASCGSFLKGYKMRILYFFIKEIIASYDHHEQLNPKN